MGVIVTFDPVGWAARYTEFAYLPQATILAYAAEAQMYLRNDGGGPVNNATVQLTLLNMVTAHVAALNAPLPNGQPGPTLVGRISSASEGSVSVSAQNDYPPGTPQFFQQTKYGSAFWAASAPYRRMKYVSGAGRAAYGAPFSGGPGWPGWPF